MAGERTIIDSWEDLFEGAAADLLSDQEALYEAAGARPLFYEEKDKLTRMNMYLTMRDNPDAWEAWISQQARLFGREAAEAFAICEDVRYDKEVADFGGPMAVVAAVLKRHVEEAKRGMAKAQALMDKPKLPLRAPDPPLDETVLLRQLMVEVGL